MRYDTETVKILYRYVVSKEEPILAIDALRRVQSIPSPPVDEFTVREAMWELLSQKEMRLTPGRCLVMTSKGRRWGGSDE